MAHIPLLTQQEEVDLAMRIERASEALNVLSQHANSLNHDHRNELENEIRDGYLAREHLIKANTRLVVSIAKKYIGNGVPDIVYDAKPLKTLFLNQNIIEGYTGL